jgi:hypothetical protein
VRRWREPGQPGSSRPSRLHQSPVVLSLAALVLLPSLTVRFAFVLCALAIEATGLTLAVRSHMAEALESQR